jgi:hypothetical protein
VVIGHLWSRGIFPIEPYGSPLHHQSSLPRQRQVRGGDRSSGRSSQRGGRITFSHCRSVSPCDSPPRSIMPPSSVALAIALRPPSTHRFWMPPTRVSNSFPPPPPPAPPTVPSLPNRETASTSQLTPPRGLRRRRRRRRRRRAQHERRRQRDSRRRGGPAAGRCRLRRRRDPGQRRGATAHARICTRKRANAHALTHLAAAPPPATGPASRFSGPSHRPPLGVMVGAHKPSRH